MHSIRLYINDQEVEAESNQTIMDVADRSGVVIPRLCHHPSLKPSGSCRLCAVEIEGQRGLPAACSTPVVDGMRVWTGTPKVLDFRREMLRLILQDHPRECLGCPRNGTCELQRLVETVGIDFPYPPPVLKRPPAETVGTCFERDMSLCVRCGRCVRVCHEVRGARVIVFREKGGRQEVATPLGRSLVESGCQLCGACVDVCPVGALRDRADATTAQAGERMRDLCENLSRMVMDLFRKESPRTRRQSHCTLCSSCCSMSFELAESGRILQVRPSRNGSGASGQACVQGRYYLKDYLQREDRLLKPLVLEDGSYRPADWDSVLSLLAEKLQGYGAWETAVLTDAGLFTEELFFLQKFARTVLKTNLVGCLTPVGQASMEEAMCRLPQASAFRGKLSELPQAGCVLAIGVNPPASQPVAGTILRRAVLEGTKLVSAGPLSVGISRYADLHLSTYPGSELVLLAGLAHLILLEQSEAAASQASKELDIVSLRSHLAPYGPEEVARLTGAPVEQLIEAACLLKSHSPLTILYGPGAAELTDAREFIQGMVTLIQLTGGKPSSGGGLIPLYGKANAKGAADLGMISPLFGTFSRGLEKLYPRATHVGEALSSGQVRALILAFDSLESSLFEEVRPHLDGLEFVVLQDTVLPSAVGESEHPALQVVLPMASALEREGTITTMDGSALAVAQVVSPPGEARSVLWTLQELARRMNASGLSSQSEETLRQDIWKEISAGTNPGRKHHKAGSPCCGCAGGSGSQSASGCETGLPAWKPPPPPPSSVLSDEYPFLVVPKEILEPYFLGPLQAEETRAVFLPEGEIELSPAEAFRLELSPGDPVRIVTPTGSWEGRLAQNPLLAEGMAAIPLTLYHSLVPELGPEARMTAGRVEKKS
jgi:predicted molibdopterin-dependent oxidoreductase YjgC